MTDTHFPTPPGGPTQTFVNVPLAKVKKADDATPAAPIVTNVTGNESLAELQGYIQVLFTDAASGNGVAAAALDGVRNAYAIREAADQAALANKASTTTVVSAAASENALTVAAVETTDPNMVPIAGTVIAGPKGVTGSVSAAIPAAEIPSAVGDTRFQTMVTDAAAHHHHGGTHKQK